MTPTERQHWLFTKGWAILAEMYGWSEAKARRNVGKLLKAAQGPQLAMRAVESIQVRQPVDPMPWGMAVIREEQARQAEKHRPGYRPQANLPPQVPLGERVKPERFAELREFLESK